MIRGRIPIDSESLKNLPNTTGVYFFLNKENVPVYIGKAINIAARIGNHIADTKNIKEAKMREASAYLDWRETNSEFEALLLEAKMIKKYSPVFNVSLKDDKTNAYIVIPKQKLPRILFVRENQIPDNLLFWFGPLTSMHMARSLMRRIRRSIPFCTDQRKSACFYSHIGLCSPCPGVIEKLENGEEKKVLTSQYNRNIRRVISVLNGNGERVIRLLKRDMKEYSDNEQFEEAAIIRNRMTHLHELFRKRLFFDEQLEDPMFLYKKRTEDSEDLKRVLAMSKLDRIECFDVSLFSAKQAVASMVVFTQGAPNKKEYRRFRIRKKSIYDPQMLAEVLKRRLTHTEWQLPDVIIIDGGRPQLRYVFTSLEKQLGVIPEIIGIAKRPDRLIRARTLEPIDVTSDSPALHYVQRARDEAHRFARKYHISLRTKLQFR
ncbi:MAG: UvrB/UvrC motif-containing protein [Candidatus Roizmanbacteria bacterium]|nr:UvrB/UvrC motif-containing protein [Candidatus Roizmanbacteria bacterium]